MFPLAAAALASPLDDAAGAGRPVVVVVERADRDRHVAVWLRHATGGARARIDAVTLVLATPAELAAWTGRVVDADADLILLNPVHRVAVGAKQVVLPGRFGASSAAYGTVLGAGVFPGEVPGKGSTGYSTQEEVSQAIRGTVLAWDTALRGLLPRGIKLVAPEGGRPEVLGADWCQATGCGTHCEQDGPGLFRLCGMGYVDPLSRELLVRWDPL